MIGMYYSIVHTYHIHCSDTSVNVYARWVGFQMSRLAAREQALAAAGPELATLAGG